MLLGGIIIDESWEEVGEERIAPESLFKSGRVGAVVVQPSVGLGCKLQQEVGMCRVLPGHVLIVQGFRGIVQLVAAVGGPIGSLGHSRVALCILIGSEQRLTVAVKIGAEEGVGIVPLAFADEESAGAVDVGPVVVEHGSVLIPMARVDASFLVGLHVEAVERLGNGSIVDKTTVSASDKVFRWPGHTVP